MNKNERELTDLLAELMKSGSGAIYEWEYLVIYPVSNQAQILYRGIEDAVKSKSYICAASLLRSLIESVMSLIYALTVPKEDESEFYAKFIEKKRFQRYSKSKKKWENVRDENLISQFEHVTKLGVRKTYNNLCDILHFSIAHMQMMGTSSKGEPGNTAIKISGDGPEVNQKKYDQIMKMSDDIMGIIKRFIAAEIHYKRDRVNEPVSKIASKVIDPSEVHYANK